MAFTLDHWDATSLLVMQAVMDMSFGDIERFLEGLLDAQGSPRTSEAWAQWLGKHMDRGESLAFAVGSSHGFDPSLKTEIREHLSLSPMTFPHDLSRVLFLEQLYRALRCQNNDCAKTWNRDDLGSKNIGMQGLHLLQHHSYHPWLAVARP